MYCSPCLATKVVGCLTLFSLAAKAFIHAVECLTVTDLIIDVYVIVFNVVVPVTVLVINAATTLNPDSVNVLRQVAFAWRDLVYAYNFFVYLITGRHFRSELRKLVRCCVFLPSE